VTEEGFLPLDNTLVPLLPLLDPVPLRLLLLPPLPLPLLLLRDDFMMMEDPGSRALLGPLTPLSSTRSAE